MAASITLEGYNIRQIPMTKLQKEVRDASLSGNKNVDYKSKDEGSNPSRLIADWTSS